MTNRKSWFGWVKRLFVSESKDKKQKKWRWSIGKIKQKQYPTITAPKNRTLIEANAEQRKHALAVAIASAAAAEAAVAAAHAAAEVVKLTAPSSSYSYLSNEDTNLSAINIQSAYRGHLARKALRALKGVIRLQAIIRGEVVRHQVSRTLKHFPSKERRNHIDEENYRNEQIKQFPKQRSWDCSSHTREDIESIWSRKQEALVKRERMRQYSSSQRERKISQMVEESLHSKGFRKDSSRTLGEWLHKETHDWGVLYKPVLPSDIIVKNAVQEPLSSRISNSRKSFSHVKRCSIGDEISMPNSPVFPKYMAVTESSKAKVRSMSTPRQRGAFLDICSYQNEPHKEGNPSCSSHVANFHMHI